MDDEWKWTMQMSKSFVSDPEQLQNFWATVMERKKDVPGYSVFMDFPQESLEPKANLKICGEIIEMLKKHKQPTIEE